MGAITTSWPVLAAVIPPSTPRHDITVAPGASPPSRISSHPMSRRPWSASHLSICLTNHDCISCSSLSPSALIFACTRSLAIHCVFGHSSPPMWMNFEGNSDSTSASTFCRNSMVESSVLYTLGFTPQVVITLSCWPVLPSSGYAAMAACECPGISISGTTFTCRAAAYATTSRISSCV